MVSAVIMGEQWNIIFYETETGVSPVKNFISEIKDKKLQSKILQEISLLENLGNKLTGPHTKYIDEGIWELRIKQSNNICRILYFYYIGNNIILTNGFVKKTKGTPKGEIKKAKEYRANYLKRRA